MTRIDDSLLATITGGTDEGCAITNGTGGPASVGVGSEPMKPLDAGQTRTVPAGTFAYLTHGTNWGGGMCLPGHAYELR